MPSSIAACHAHGNFAKISSLDLPSGISQT
jgi:hypothetical protein